MDFFQVSDTLFRKFIKWGMPARSIAGRWYAHTGNLDEWFRRLTRASHKER